MTGARSQVWGNWRSGPWSALYWNAGQDAWVLETSDKRPAGPAVGGHRYREPVQARVVLTFRWRWAARVSRRMWWARAGRRHWDGEQVVPPRWLRPRTPRWWGRHRFGEMG